MPKYERGIASLKEKVNPIHQGILGGIEGGYNAYKTEKAKTILSDPNASAVQKAMAWQSISSGKAGDAEIFKSILSAEAEAKQAPIENAIRSKLGLPTQEVSERAGVPKLATEQSPTQAAIQQFGNVVEPGQTGQFGAPTLFEGKQYAPAPSAFPTGEAFSPQQQPAGVPEQPAPFSPLDIPLDELIQQRAIAKSPSTQKALDQLIQAKNTERAAQAQENKAKLKIVHDNQKDLAEIQKDSLSTIKSSNSTLKAFDDQLSVVDKTGVFSKANLSKWLTDHGFETLGRAAQSEGGAIFATAGKEIITGGLKSAFGARPLGVEFAAFESMLAQVGRSPEVNKLAIKSLKLPYEIDNDVARFKMNIIAKNPNITPVELNSAAYLYGEEVRDQKISAWRQEVNDTMRKVGGQMPQEVPKTKALGDIWGQAQ